MNNEKNSNSDSGSDAATQPVTQKPKLPKKVSPMKWTILVILLFLLIAIVVASPALNRYLPSFNQPSYSSSSSSRSSDSSQPVDITIDKEQAAEVYFGLTVAMPVMIGIITFATIINTIFFISMALNISSIQRMLSTQLDDDGR